MKKVLKLRELFVCNRCRTECSGHTECMNELGELYPRKQFVECLGEYCDTPCSLQTSSALTIELLIPIIIYLGTELNEFYLGTELNEFLITDPQGETNDKEIS